MKQESLIDLLHATYRGARISTREQVASLTTMDVTLASEGVVFERVGSSSLSYLSVT